MNQSISEGMGENDTDSKLIEGIRQGNLQAFGKLYDRYAPALYGIILRIVVDRQKSEYVLQKSFMAIWKSIHTYNPAKERLFIRLLSIAKNMATEAVSGESVKSSGKTEIYLTKNLVYEQHVSDSQNDQPHLGEFSSTLEQKEVTALDLICFKGYSVSRAAEELGVDIADLKKQIRAELRNSSEEK